MTKLQKSDKGDGENLTEEINLGEAGIIVGDRYVQKQKQEI